MTSLHQLVASPNNGCLLLNLPEGCVHSDMNTVNTYAHTTKGVYQVPIIMYYAHAIDLAPRNITMIKNDLTCQHT